MIYNNFVHIDNDAKVYGMYFNACYHQNFYHNSVNVISSNAESNAFYHYVAYTYEIGLTCKNNIFNVVGPGPALRVWWGDGTVAGLDYNNYYTLGSTLIYWRHNNNKLTWSFNSISALNSTLGWEEHGQNFNPVYASETDLHADSYWMDNLGTPISGITEDIDGETRHISTPDIGADEYTSSIVPMNGTFIIDASGSGDYLSFNEAVDDLELKGVAESNIRRQLKRLRDLMIVEKKGNLYNLTEFDSLANIFENRIEKFIISQATDRIKEYLKAIE